VSELKQNLKYVTRLGVKGLISSILQEPVNIVNAEFVAKGRGMNIIEKTSGEAGEYKSLITLTVTTAKGQNKISGYVSKENGARIISIGKFKTDLVPAGNVILANHVNRPGIIGVVGTILGKNNVNISSMQVGGANVGTDSLMILAVDSIVSPEIMKQVANGDGITSAKFVQL
ncbi:MAG TPA: ACT domain-containing protein, partial [Methanocorpusculum sp.]|nr:ACT domain-containing protein [Methanocorpusculum sp.]